MEVTSTRFLPLLVSSLDGQLHGEHVVDAFTGDLSVAYSFGPPYGERLVTWSDLDRMGRARRVVRRIALENLAYAASRLRVDGQPPALLLSFGGLECAALLVDELWIELARSVPGELVVGVPARDVVVVTGSRSAPGMEKVRRTVDRVFFAGGPHLLSRELLSWRDGTWQPATPAAPPAPPQRPAPRPYPDRRRSSDPSR